jgi:hypothetical protein
MLLHAALMFGSIKVRRFVRCTVCLRSVYCKKFCAGQEYAGVTMICPRPQSWQLASVDPAWTQHGFAYATIMMVMLTASCGDNTERIVQRQRARCSRPVVVKPPAR